MDFGVDKNGTITFARIRITGTKSKGFPVLYFRIVKSFKKRDVRYKVHRKKCREMTNAHG